MSSSAGPSQGATTLAVTLGVWGVALLVGVAAAASPWSLAAALTLCAAVVAWGWPGMLALPTPRGTVAVVLVGGLALVTSVLVTDSEPWLEWMPVALALAMITSFAHQLLRQDGRPRLVMTLAGTALGLGILGAGAYYIAAIDTHEARRLMLAVGLATLAGSVLDGVAGATSRRLELGAGQCLLGAAVAMAAVIAGADVLGAALAGAAAGLLSWACLRTTVTLATSAHTRAQVAAGCACVLVCGLIPVAVARLV